MIALLAGTATDTVPAFAHHTVKVYVLLLPDSSLTEGVQLPDTASELCVTPVTLALNTTVTAIGLLVVMPPALTAAEIELTFTGVGTACTTQTQTQTHKSAPSRRPLCTQQRRLP
jgi:hypothetical protein